MANSLETKFCGKTFKNPVIAASGTFNFGREFSALFDLSMLGGICTKGLTLLPRQGNNAPRIAETPSGILNSVGLQNPGFDAFAEKELPFMRKYDTVLIANAAGNTEDDYAILVEKLCETSVDMIELNISCPNVKEGGVAFGTSCQSVEKIVKRIKAITNDKKPLIVKLSPNVSSIKDIAIACEYSGADAISLINTITGMAIDFEKRRPLLANITGGLSGPCVKPVALRMVYEASKSVKIPVIGLGGITNYKDVIEFMLCGASAVQIGTASISDPLIYLDIIRDLNEYLYAKNIFSITELIGGLKV